MFDIGFSELIVIGVVALVVIGPERLPKVARTTGLLLGRLQRYVNDVKADIGREMQLEELKKLQAEVRQTARDFERSVSNEVQAIEHGVGQTVASLKADIQGAAPSSSAAPALEESEEPEDETPANEQAPARDEVSPPAAKE
ncbi:MAG: Sec-independent protein translocase protein TatB [Candidatus Accumulibacter sp.]|jgi:sec-independent protein translocase protein TatB|nr:Sec-independent protein translocase protein TatB [Accumulibacter sp.]